MKKYIGLFVLLFCNVTFAQNNYEIAQQYLSTRGEVYFTFKEENPLVIQKISQIVSLDKKNNSEWFAYANKHEFSSFVKYNIPYKVLIPPSLSKTKGSIQMASTIAEMQQWDKYPTYDVYLQMMQQFAAKHPFLCKVDTIGYSLNNRLILAVKIAKNAHAESTNPEFFYSSSMHGDELTGFVLMLRLIDYLLENNTTPFVDEILTNVQVYINPLSNPDGTYKIGNNTVVGSTRFNANSIDLNRNYPDPFGKQPETPLQIENIAMINYITKHKFVMSGNIHGGAEVMNYPWDNFIASVKSTADAEWWQTISQQFVDTCRVINPNCFKDVDETGVSNGGDWYVISYGRQDYVNFVHYCREVTMEISSDKLISSNKLDSYWQHLHKSFLYYIKQVNYGIKGIVTDSATNTPIKAKVVINNHDKDNSHIHSFLPFGNYIRPLKEGNYAVTISAPGYQSKIFENIHVEDLQTSILNAKLQKEEVHNSFIYPNPVVGNVNILTKVGIKEIEIVDLTGAVLLKQKGDNAFNVQINTSVIAAGMYIVKIYFEDTSPIIQKIVILH